MRSHPVLPLCGALPRRGLFRGTYENRMFWRARRGAAAYGHVTPSPDLFRHDRTTRCRPCTAGAGTGQRRGGAHHGQHAQPHRGGGRKAAARPVRHVQQRRRDHRRRTPELQPGHARPGAQQQRQRALVRDRHRQQQLHDSRPQRRGRDPADAILTGDLGEGGRRGTGHRDHPPWHPRHLGCGSGGGAARPAVDPAGTRFAGRRDHRGNRRPHVRARAEIRTGRRREGLSVRGVRRIRPGGRGRDRGARGRPGVRPREGYPLHLARQRFPQGGRIRADSRQGAVRAQRRPGFRCPAHLRTHPRPAGLGPDQRPRLFRAGVRQREPGLAGAARYLSGPLSGRAGLRHRRPLASGIGDRLRGYRPGHQLLARGRVSARRPA